MLSVYVPWKAALTRQHAVNSKIYRYETHSEIVHHHHRMRLKSQIALWY